MNSSQTVSGVQPGEVPRSLPKIPVYGPAAQLSPQVLLSKFGELSANKPQAARKVRGISGKDAIAHKPKVPHVRPIVLPNLDGLSTTRHPATARGEGFSRHQGSASALLSGSYSAREPREGLATLLFRGDHTLHLPSLEDIDPLAGGDSLASREASLLSLASLPSAGLATANNNNTNNNDHYSGLLGGPHHHHHQVQGQQQHQQQQHGPHQGPLVGHSVGVGVGVGGGVGGGVAAGAGAGGGGATASLAAGVGGGPSRDLSKTTLRSANTQSAGKLLAGDSMMSSSLLERSQDDDAFSSTTRAYRHARLKDSFRREAKDIDVAMQWIRRWSVRVDMEGDSLPDTKDESIVEDLKQKVGKASLNATPPRTTVQNKLPARMSESAEYQAEEEHEEPDAEFNVAPRSEIAASVAVLNLVRWLCRLPSVVHDPTRTEVCKVVNQALVPRVPENARLHGAPRELAEGLSKAFETGAEVGLLHGEASLPVAVEKSLAGVYSLTPPPHKPPVGAAREAYAQSLAARIECERPPGSLAPELHRQPTFNVVARKPQEPPPSIVGLHDLPAHLVPYRILWELKPKQAGVGQRNDRPANAAASWLNQASLAPPPSQFSPRALPPPLLDHGGGGSAMSLPTPKRAFTATTAASPCRRLGAGGAGDMPPSACAAATDALLPSELSQQSSKKLLADPVAGLTFRPKINKKKEPKRRVCDDLSTVDEFHPSTYGLCSIWGDKRSALALRRTLLNPCLRSFGASRQHDTCVLWTSHTRKLFPGAPHKTSNSNNNSNNNSNTNNNNNNNNSNGSGNNNNRSQGAGRAASQNAEANRRHFSLDGADIKTHLLEAVNNPNARDSLAQVQSIDAVCYPPTGIVPIALLEGGSVPWTIMPNASKFQPTSKTRVRVWLVHIERNTAEWTADRLQEVAVRGMSVDCSLQGEPFCVIFWPDAALEATSGLQLEVELSGLTGLSQELTFFYELQAFHTRDLDRGLIAESARLRSLLGDGSLWANSQIPACLKEHRNLGRDRRTIADTKNRRPSVQRGRSLSSHFLDDQQRAPLIETMSHHNTQIVTNSVDIRLTLKSEAICALEAELLIIRFGEGEEVVPHGAQVHKLSESHYLILVKLPMARCRYELRFWTAKHEAPHDMVKHPLKYSITTGEQCQMLLSSMEDPLLKVFGLARVSVEAQHHGIVILAPMIQRVLVASCYFLVYVDEAKALAYAREQAAAQAVQMRTVSRGGLRGIDRSRPSEVNPSLPWSSAQGSSGASFGALSGGLLKGLGDSGPPQNGDQGLQLSGSLASLGSQSRRKYAPPDTSLFSKRLLSQDIPAHPEIFEMHELLRSTFEPRTKDSCGEVHLDLTTSWGECRGQLRPRVDFPGFYEGLITLTESEVNKILRLQLRFPKVQQEEFSPKVLCEWTVCRGEHFPIGF